MCKWFYIGKYEVTQKQWSDIMNNNPSYFNNNSDFPVEQVTWDDGKEFISRLNKRSDKTFRVPTEAEWEYAARGGGDFIYSGSNKIDDVAWYYENSEGRTHKVGTKVPNGFGIHDMSGNVWEWVEDIYNSEAYSSHQLNNPIYNGKGTDRALRGSSWRRSSRQSLRLADRLNHGPSFSYKILGFVWLDQQNDPIEQLSFVILSSFIPIDLSFFRNSNRTIKIRDIKKYPKYKSRIL